MTQRDLHEQLTQLDKELVAARSVDPASRDLLQRLAEDIRAIIETGPQSRTADEYRGLRGRLAEAVVSFEGSHPRLSVTIESLIDTLSQHTL